VGFATAAARRLETVSGVEDIRTAAKDQRREIQVAIDRERAERLGVDARDLADLFSFTLGGMRLPRFNAGRHEVETWLALRLEDRENLEDLKQLPVGNEEGEPVLLGDIAEFEVLARPREIRREDRKVQVSVDATYEGKKWEEAKAEITGLMDAFELPAGYSWGWNDRVLEQENEGQQMAINMVLALLLVYIVMASLFESLAQPFAILFSIPFALPGAAWLLAATGTSFNLMAQIGLLILMGIVVNNGIVLLDHVNRLRRDGLSTEEAILQGGRDRLRPILMTASTTIIGLIPLAVQGPSVGGVFYYPLARTVMGGLLTSSILTLVALPYVNLGVEGFAAWVKRVWRRSGAPAPVAAAPDAADSGRAPEPA
jgi:HAE1 family hydrophobic/amphiphilic exporter-1